MSQYTGKVCSSAVGEIKQIVRGEVDQFARSIIPMHDSMHAAVQLQASYWAKIQNTRKPVIYMHVLPKQVFYLGSECMLSSSFASTRR